MAARFQCPRCGARNSWLLRDGRRRCARCRRDWRPGRLPLRLSPQQWRAVLQWFVRGASSADIAMETRLERKRVLRALLIVRQSIVRATSGHGRRALTRERPSRAAVPTSTPRPVRHATLGLGVAEGHAWAEIVSDAEAEHVGRWVRERQNPEALVRPGLRQYTAVVHRGRLYRLAPADGDRSRFGRIEAFWSYLQRQLRATGGIRPERVPLYLAALSWRYHRRKLPQAQQVRELLELIRGPQ